MQCRLGSCADLHGRGEDGRPAGASQLKTDSNFHAGSRRALQNASEREFRFLKSNLMAVGTRASYCSSAGPNTAQADADCERGERDHGASVEPNSFGRLSQQLLGGRLRLAAKVARRYQGYGLPLADLVSEANLGLVLAASRFQPGRNARFSSYALWWIKATIHDYILRSWSLVKIGTTVTQKEAFFQASR
jgi:Sigma-70 region 2